MKQTCILVLGMHRSGTSALTGVLNMLDVYLGTELMEANVANEKGYFENNHLYKVNEKLLSQIGSSWDDTFYDETKVSSIIKTDELKETIQKEFEFANLFAIKDPRLIYLFPIYKKVLEELDIDVKIILPYRNPIEVASSLNRRDGMPLEKGMLLWAYNFLLAEKHSRGYDRVFINFDELINNTDDTVENLSKYLNLKFIAKYKKNKKSIDEFLEPGLKHHNISIENLSCKTPKIVKNIVSLMGQLNSKNMDIELDNLKEDLFGYKKIFYNSEIINFLKERKKLTMILAEKQEELSKSIQRILKLQDEVEEKNQWAFNLNSTINELEDVLAKTRESVTKLEEDIQRKEQQEEKYLATISELEDILAKTRESVTKLEEEIQSKKERESVTKLEEDIQSKKEQEQNYLVTISKLEDIIAKCMDRDAQSKGALEENYLATIGELEDILAKRMDRIVELQEEVEEKNQWAFDLNDRIKELEKISNVYHQIISSKGWKLLSKYYGMKELITIVKNTLLHPLKLYKVGNKHYINRVIHHIKQGNYAYILERMGYYINTESSKIQLDLMSAAHVDEVLEFPIVNSPKVSIIVPVYNQFDYTYNCLKSILEHTEGIEYEIIIADDVSSDATININQFIKNINVVRNKENLGFLLNCNNAAAEARGEYIFFLNNDTNVQKDWLSTLLVTIENNETIGMIGSKLVYADGRQQEAGGIIWNDASGWNFGRLDNPEKPEYNYLKEVDYISGAAIMIRSKLWREIGGFDERYVPAYYEDSDLAFEVRKHGYKVVMQPKSIVVHFEGISNGTDTSSGIKKYQVVNNEKFFDKWKDVLEKEHFPNAQDVFLARDRSKDKKHILIIDHYVPHYDKDAGSRTMWQYLVLLKELDYSITFVGDNFYKHEPYTTLLESIGVEVLYGPHYFNNFNTWLEENGKYFNFVYLLRPHIAIKYIDKIKANTSAKIFYNGTDFHFLRMQREYEISKDKKLLNEIKNMEQQEISLFEKADVVLTISHYEKEYFQNRFKSWKIEVIPTFIYTESLPLSINDNFNKREDILFVGGFTHTPNLEGVKWFLKKIWPLIESKNPKTKFYIVGSNMPKELQKMASENIIIKGFVEDDELKLLYNQIKVVVAPLTFGAGVKGKIIESICHGIPTVTTKVGAEGIIDNQQILAVQDSPAEFANEVISYLCNQDKWTEMRVNQVEYAKKHFSANSTKELINQIFSEDK